MFCPNCGTEIREGANFCSNCGGKIEYLSKSIKQPQLNVEPESEPQHQSQMKSQTEVEATPGIQLLDNTTDAIISLSIKGRRKRLVFFLVNICLILVMSILTKLNPNGFSLFSLLFFLFCCVESFINTTKRLHDINLATWVSIVVSIMQIGAGIFQLGVENNEIYRMILNAHISRLIVYSYFISIICNLILLFWPGTKGPNKYGSPPTKWRLSE